jgi:hypothetical protein
MDIVDKISKIKEYQKQYRLKNRKKAILYAKNYYIINKEKLLNKVKEYYFKNKKKVRIYRNLWEKNKRKTDLNFKLKINLRQRIRDALKKTRKSKKTLELIGMSIPELWKYLESKFQKGMTKENHGLWEIDHIIPCSAFDLTKPEEQLKCFHYTNLQPLWVFQNRRKGAKLNYGQNQIQSFI